MPGGDAKLRPLRPRPAVWESATTSVPCGAPAAAICFAVRLVDSSSCATTRLSDLFRKNSRTPCSDSTSLSVSSV